MEKYEQVKRIGSGAMGTAFLIRRKFPSRSDGLALVMKKISLMGLTEEEKLKAMQEVECLRSLKHRNITALYETFINEEEALCIVMEYADGGDLAKFIKESKAKLKEDKILDIFAQLCWDIKCANILLTLDGVVKLADFGVARVLSAQSNFANTCIGTPFYLSPEICEGRSYTDKSDVWSLGCVLYELITLDHAFTAPNLPALIMKIVQGKYPPLPASTSPHLAALVTSMLHLDPDSRPAVADILTNPHLQPHLRPGPSDTPTADPATPAAAGDRWHSEQAFAPVHEPAHPAPAAAAAAAPRKAAAAAANGDRPSPAAAGAKSPAPLRKGGALAKHFSQPTVGAAGAATTSVGISSGKSAAGAAAPRARALSAGPRKHAPSAAVASEASGRRSVAATASSPAAGRSSMANPSPDPRKAAPAARDIECAGKRPPGPRLDGGGSGGSGGSGGGGVSGAVGIGPGGPAVQKEKRRVSVQQEERREVMSLPDQVPPDDGEAERRLARLLRS